MSLAPLQSAFGLCVLIALAWGLSRDRSAISWRFVGAAVGLQLALGLLLLRVGPAREALFALNGVVEAISAATAQGTGFVFGYIGGGAAPFEITQPQAMFVLAFQALPLVLILSALSALFWHWRILPLIIEGLSWALRRLLGLRGSVSLAVAANVFVGMVEAPLLIRPRIATLSRADLFALMTVGLATIAGTVLVLYAQVLSPVIPGALGQILAASLISLPAAVLVARLMEPETEPPAIADDDETHMASPYEGSLSALVEGTRQGLELLLNIIATLLVAVALVALINILLGLCPDVAGEPLSFQRLAGWAFAPLVWLLGVPWSEAVTAGQLMGIKIVLNELLAYIELVSLPEDALSPRSDLIMAYALCGFANPGSLGIMIGGLTVLAPQRRAEIVGLAGRAFIAGTLATSMTGAVVGILY